MENNLLKLSSGLWLDLYELAMAQVYFKYKSPTQASFELFIRSQRRPFYVAYGVGEALDYLARLKFSSQDLSYLENLKLFDREFLNYLKNFRFKGDVWAVDEPEIIFATEPILRVSADLIEAQIVESGLLNIMNLYTTLATKALRVVLAAQGRKVYDFSLRRTQGKDASLAIAKASFVAGAEGTSNLLAGFLYNIPVVGTMAHSYVMSFSSELDSFHAFLRTFPEKTIFLIDTYDVKSALENIVKLSSCFKNKKQFIGVRIDSGDLLEVSKYVRAYLDKASLIDMIIVASGNLDEYKIKELIEKKAPIDAFGVGTNMGTSSDLPFTDMNYKLVEVKNWKGEFTPLMKLSSGKVTYPLKKQIFRKFTPQGLMREDILGEMSESLGKPLLKKVMQAGKILEPKEDLISQRKKLKKKLETLPSFLREIKEFQEGEDFARYPLKISNKLNKAVSFTQLLIKKRSSQKRVIFFDVDTQFDFVDKKGALYVKGAEKLKNIWASLTKFAAQEGILIISSQDTHKKDDPEFREFLPHCVKGSWGYRKIPQTTLSSHRVVGLKVEAFEELFKIKDSFSQIILEKNTLDVFSNPNTKTLLESILAEEVYVYGLVTEFCVKKAALGLRKFVENVFVLEDAIKEISEEARASTFEEFNRTGIKIVRSDEVLKKLKNF